jgi:hypothetical protein
MSIVVDKILSGAYPLATILLLLLAMIIVVYLLRNILLKGIQKTLEEYFATKQDIQSLKNNDLFHTNKALLIGFSELLKSNPQLFERMRDTILETTPDEKKSEIKKI